MQIHTIPSGPLETNTFLIDNGVGEALLIDAPPGGYGDIMPLLKKKKLTLKAVLITHGHFDHVLDAPRFQADGVPLFVHADSEEMVRDPAKWMPFPFPGVDLSGLEWQERDGFLEAGETRELAGLEVEVRLAPGHCPGSLVFYFPRLSAAFVGDVIFHRSIGRTDLPGGDTALLMDSIRNELLTLPGNTLLHPGHGPLTMVDEEREFNPFL